MDYDEAEDYSEDFMADVQWREIPRTRDWYTGQLRNPEVAVKPHDFAYGVWHALAVTLAEPLRQAFRQHLDGCRVCHERGIGYCPTGSELFWLQPPGDTVLIG